MRHAYRLTALACVGILLGGAIAHAVPTEMVVKRNAVLGQLSQPRIVSYPLAQNNAALPDSYPITYSPQWIAVGQAAERERMARWDMPEAAMPTGYEQPSPERDLAVEREGIDSDAQVADMAEPQAETAQLAEADVPAS